MKVTLTTKIHIILLVSALYFLTGCATTKDISAENRSDNKPLSSYFDNGEEIPAESASKKQQSSVANPAPREYQPKNVIYTSEDYHDLWDRIRAGYDLPALNSKHVAEYERWYSSRPQYIERLINRALSLIHI